MLGSCGLINPWYHLRKMSSWVGNPGRPPYVIPRRSAGLKKKGDLYPHVGGAESNRTRNVQFQLLDKTTKTTEECLLFKAFNVDFFEIQRGRSRDRSIVGD